MSAEAGNAVNLREGLPLVAINTATRAEIDALYQIGPTLAERIAAHRQLHGPFRGPDDLARVEGVGTELALLLSPHIDWSPPDAAQELREASFVAFWVNVVVCLAGGFVVYTVGDVLISMIGRSVAEGGLAAGNALHMGLGVSSLVAGMCWVGAAAIRAVSALSRSTQRRARYQRLTARVNLIAAIAGLGIGVTIAMDVLASARPGGLTDLLRSPQTVALLLIPAASVSFAGPILLVTLYPALVSNRLLTLLFNASFPVLGVAVGATTWFMRNQFPPLLLLFNGCSGIMNLLAGVLVLRGHSMLAYVLPEFSQKLDSDNLWVRWINLRVPDPEQQKALLAALQQVHPPSRWRTIGGVLIVGVGAWLLAGTAGAILEWVVQGWLDGVTGRR